MKNKTHPALLSALAILAALAAVVPARAAGPNLAVLQNRGKAGVYIRMAEADQHNANIRKVISANPNVDCVLLNAFWAELEPSPGVFDFSALKRDIDDWSANGKHVVIHIALYGQAVDDHITPSWIYKNKDVRTITFAGGGMAAGEQVRIPAVWNEGFAEKYVKPLVTRIAAEFDGDQRIWYIHPGFGHLGHLTAQPSPGGAPALKSAGWTAPLWIKYCTRTFALYRSAFKKTPFLVTNSPLLIRDKPHEHYALETLSFCEVLARQGVSVDYLGITANQIGNTPLYKSARNVLSFAEQGTCRLGFGDDWPLWVPESRRAKPPTVGFDNAYFASCLHNCFDTGKTSLPTTMLYLNPPEALATSPASPDGLAGHNRECFYRRDLSEILERARAKLFENDKKIF